MSNAEAIKMASFLDKSVVPHLKAQLAKVGNKISEARLNKILAETKAFVSDAYKKAGGSLKSKLGQVAENEAKWQKSLIPVSIVIIKLPPIGMLRDLPAKVPVQGAFVNDWMDNMGRKTAFEINRGIKMGVVSGEGIDAITRRLTGTKANNYKDGIVPTAKRHVQTIVRTSINELSAVAREETFKANEDVISGVMMVATLDDRTTEICQEQDGKVYPVDEGPRPPFHFNCRTTVVPVLKSWKELGIALKDVPETTRASMDGQVPATMTYKEWNKEKSKNK
jgi:SPP1 gp7 family putative phage head morphogenesis protein